MRRLLRKCLGDFSQTSMRAWPAWRDLLDQRISLRLSSADLGIAQIKQCAEVVGVQAFIALCVEADRCSAASISGDDQATSLRLNKDRFNEFIPVHKTSVRKENRSMVTTTEARTKLYTSARSVACIGALKLYGLALAALLCDWMSK